MDAHLQALDPLLNMGTDDEVRIIGIWGMGGVGKTTIAEFLYSMYKRQFQFHCFIHDIKKIYSEQGLEKLLHLYLSKILNDEKFMSETTEIDSDMIKSRLCHQRVLAVLDDVNDLDQLEALAKHTTWFGLGSRIIVTTRDKALFIAHGVELVHEVRCLEDDDALSLFNCFAFGGKQVPDDFTELSKRALELVKGLPLAIKLLGTALRGRKIKEWKPIIRRLEKVPDKTIMACLKVSYDVLNERDKDIFLTIACLLSGEYESHLLALLDDEDCEVQKSVDDEDCEVDISVDDEDCEFNTSLNTLAEKALIDISEDGQVTVHDLIRDMAKEIVRQHSNKELRRQRFLWDPKDIYKVLANGKETKAIEGISLDMSKIKSFPMGSKSFENIPNLKFLVVRNTSRYRGDISQLCNAINHLPPGLKLLDWENCPLTTLPPTFEPKCLVDLRLAHSLLERLSVKDLYLEKLRKLEFQSCLHLKEIPKLPRNIVEINFSRTNIEGMLEIPNLPTLKILNLTECWKLLEIPNAIGNLTSLQTLILESCGDLLEISSSIGNLTALEKLDLSSCCELTSIPDTVGNLASLATLHLQYCDSLLEIPSSIGNLAALGELNLSSCRKLMSIPNTIGNLTSLETLHLEFCSNLLEIPSSIGNLAALGKLDLSGCEKLRSILDTIGSLTSLKHLDIQRCSMLLEIPSTVGNLALVEKLHLSNCESIRRIPDLMGSFDSLETMELKKCKMLSKISSTIGNFTNLQCLSVEDCSKLESIPSAIGNLTSLRELCIKGCEMVMEIPSIIGDLRALEDLSIENCKKLKDIPETIGNLTGLQSLKLSGCMTLLEIPSSIFNLRALEFLTIENCQNLRYIPKTAENLTALKLKALKLSGCKMLLEIPNLIGNLRALKFLHIENCEKLKNIPETIWDLTTLENLKLSGSMILLEIPSSIGNLRALKYLNIENGEKLRNIPKTIGNLTALEHLEILGCTILLEILSSIGNLRALRRLIIENGEKLRNNPETIGNLTGLEYLKLSGCTMLSEIPSSIGNVRALRRLTIKNCEKLRSIPETIGNLTALEHLELLGCTILLEIPSSIGNLRALRHLTIENGKKLRNIPETIGNLTALEYLRLLGCTTLLEIPSSIGNLKALNYLCLSNCENLQSIPRTTGNLTYLRSLALAGCNMLDDISSITGNMTSLQNLSPPEDIDWIWNIIKECPSKDPFSDWPDENVILANWKQGPRNQALEVLRLFRLGYDPKYVPCRCTKFSIFHDLRELSLRNLNLREIPDDFGHLQSIQRLDLSGNDFEIIPASIKQFHLLEQLVLSHCQKIRSIPELSPGLRYLYANDCSSLESISNVYSHPFHKLMLSDCFKLGEDSWEFIQHMIFSMPSSTGEIKMKACFSASELPAFFSHQSTEQQLTICCPQVDSGSKPMGFIAGVVVACGNLNELYQKHIGLTKSFCDISHLNIHCHWHGEGCQSKRISFDLRKLPPSVSVTTSGSDLLFVFSCNFGEEKYRNVRSFHFDFGFGMETWWMHLCSFKELEQAHAIKRCGIRLCFTEELQHAQSVLPLTSGVRMPDIDELVEEGNFLNLRSSDQSKHGGNLNSDEEALAPSSKRPKYYHSY